MRQVLGAGALGRPRGTGWRGRWEGGSGWGIHGNPWLIHVNVWQKPLQYCKVISLQLIKINGKKKVLPHDVEANAPNRAWKSWYQPSFINTLMQFTTFSYWEMFPCLLENHSNSSFPWHMARRSAFQPRGNPLEVLTLSLWVLTKAVCSKGGALGS